jgi:hypothetical protein
MHAHYDLLSITNPKRRANSTALAVKAKKRRRTPMSFIPKYSFFPRIPKKLLVLKKESSLL